MKLFFALLDGHVRWHRYSREDRAWFGRRLKEAGVTAVRLLPTWDDERVPGLPQPFLLDAGRGLYDLDRPNHVFDENLALFCEDIHAAGVQVAMDIMDNCATGKPWDAWRRNVNGICGIYETGNPELTRRLLALIDRVRRCGVDIIGLGNELRFPPLSHDEDREGLKHWAAEVIVPLARHSLKGQSYVFFSADQTEGGTANKIRSALTECEGGWLHPWEILEVIHGIGTPEHLMEYFRADLESSAVYYGISDDGVGIGDRTLALEDRGLCEEPAQRCKASVTLRLASVAVAQKHWGVRFDLVEFLAPELAMAWRELRELEPEYSVESYRKARLMLGMPVPPLIPEETKTLAYVCRRSGLLATERCASTEYREYAAGQEPKERCQECELREEEKMYTVRVCRASEKLPMDDCLISPGLKTKLVTWAEAKGLGRCDQEHDCRVRYIANRAMRKWQVGRYLLCLFRKFL